MAPISRRLFACGLCSFILACFAFPAAQSANAGAAGDGFSTAVQDYSGPEKPSPPSVPRGARLSIPEKMTFCRIDAECVPVATSCCGCSDAGINRLYLKDYQVLEEEACGARGCDKFCGTVSPAAICSEGRCVVTQPPAPPPYNSPPPQRVP